MAYEFLKKLFGTNEDGTPKAMTYAELEAAIDADKELKLANLSDGGYVSKNKLDAKLTELEGIREQLNNANAQIKSYKDMDIDGIKKAASDWETKYNEDTKKLNEQLAAQARSHAEEMFLSGYQFTSKAARNGILAELRGKNFQIENGTVLGGKEFMEGLMENDDYKGAFVQKRADDKGTGNNPASGGQPAGGQQFPYFAGSTNSDNGAAGKGMKLTELMKRANAGMDGNQLYK